MKKIAALSALVVLLVPAFALGAVVSVKEAYYLQKNETQSQNIYAAGEGIFILGNAQKDVIAAGGNIQVKGTIGGDALLAGGNINIDGNFRDDLRAAGGQISLSGTVAGDVALAGGQLDILPGTVINGDVFIAGGTAVLNGRVNGTVRAAVGEITLGEKAFIAKNFEYVSGEAATVKEGAVVSGETIFKHKEKADRGAWGFLGLFEIIKFLTYIAFGLLLLWLIPRRVGQVLEEGRTRFGRSLLTGFVVLIVTPVLGVLLLITVVGFPVGIMLLLAYATSLIFSCFATAYFLGALIWKWIKKDFRFNWQTIVIGSLAYMVLAWIPILGWLACAILFLSTYGAFARTWYENIWKNR